MEIVRAYTELLPLSSHVETLESSCVFDAAALFCTGQVNALCRLAVAPGRNPGPRLLSQGGPRSRCHLITCRSAGRMVAVSADSPSSESPRSPCASTRVCFPLPVILSERSQACRAHGLCRRRRREGHDGGERQRGGGSLSFFSTAGVRFLPARRGVALSLQGLRTRRNESAIHGACVWRSFPRPVM